MLDRASLARRRLAVAPVLAVLAVLLLGGVPAPAGAHPMAALPGRALAEAVPVPGCLGPACGGPAAPGPQIAAQTWYNVTSEQRFSPPPFVGASLAYDAQDNYLLLFGGCTASQCPAPAQTWTYSGGAWMNITSFGAQPPARSFADIAYDSHDGYVVLFGGRGAGGAPLNDSWTFAAGVWTNVTNYSAAPPARYAASMIFDHYQNFIVLFGGCGSTVCPRNDTWRFLSGGWRNVTTLAGPPPSARDGASFSWDGGDGYGVLFGGCGIVCPLGDTWQWSKGRWALLNVTGLPPARAFASLTYDAVQNLTYLVDGNGSTGPRTDVWKFTNAHWINVTAVGGPGPAHRQGMAVVESAVAASPGGVKKWYYSLFFGGTVSPCLPCANGSVGDTWVFEPTLTVSASALPTVVEVGQPVAFTSQAAGGSSPYVYLWQFGDGASTFTQKPTHAYATAGNFGSNVSVSDTSGAEVDAAVLVTVVAGPLVSASITPAASDVGRLVSFVGTASGGTAPYTYRWAFGDLTTAPTLDATHSYSVPGRYSVNLTVSDTVQGFGVADGNVTINPVPQLAASSSNLSTKVGSNVTFSATVTGGTAPFAFSWDLGDGNHTAAASSVHEYGAPGTYRVTATVADAVGAVSWQNFSIVVAPLTILPPPNNGSHGSGLSTTELVGTILLVAGVVLAALVAAVLLLRRRRREPPSLAAAPVGQAGWDAGEDEESPASSRTARRSLNRFYRRRS